MDTIPFDTHAVVKELVSVGFTQQPAEAHVNVLMRVVHDQLATKRDIVELHQSIAEIRRDVAELKRDVAEVRQEVVEIKRDIKESELRMAIRLGALIFAAVGALAILQKIF